jgi:4-amino-4-deoxy-L-arabinose transferase-like glycosyltransferase
MGWILSPALLGACVAIWQLGREAPTEKVSRRNALVLWLAWLIPSIIYFSISTFFHGYYLATIAPAVAALFGIGALALWKQWQQANRRQQIAVSIVLLICSGVQVVLLLPYPGWNTWLIPLIGGASLLGLVGLFAFQHWRSKFQSMAFAWCLFMLLIAPLIWTLIPIVTCTDETLPYAGPQVLSPGGVCKPVQIAKLLEYEWLAVFEQGRGEARYLAATHDMGIAISGILDTRQPFMALGGYRGNDPILTVEQFATLVARGEVHYYTALKDEAEYPIQKGIRQWVKAHCPPVSTGEQGILIWGPCEASK